MTGVMSILEFVAKTKVIQYELEVVGHAVVARACELICAEAKRVLGTEGYDWPQLSPATLAHKMQSGMLLETGALRASIEWNSSGNEGHVGSNFDRAVFHEFGTSKIPPRPFLAGAAMAMEDKIHKMAARAVMAVMRGEGLHGSEMGELLHFLHALHHVGHAVNEAVQKALDGPDDGNRR